MQGTCQQKVSLGMLTDGQTEPDDFSVSEFTLEKLTDLSLQV
jgi:hypothetical protein